MTTTPALIVDLARSIAIYKQHTSAADPKIEEDYKQAMRTLRDISTGNARLPSAGAEPAGTGGSGAQITAVVSGGMVSNTGDIMVTADSLGKRNADTFGINAVNLAGTLKNSGRIVAETADSVAGHAISVSVGTGDVVLNTRGHFQGLLDIASTVDVEVVSAPGTSIYWTF